MIVYVDMARWEIQQRFRRHEVKALGVDNHAEAPSLQYKRGYFNDWRICDRHKNEYFDKIEFWIDTHESHAPKMIDRATFMRGIEQTVSGPFRVVPFFDPAPWGGQWMKEVCDLDRSAENFGWCFDCVPEENSLYFEIDGHRFEIPAMDLVLLKSRELLMLFLGIFFIVGVDVATNFISSKLMIMRFDRTLSQAKIAPQIYFLSRTVGALLGAVALARISATKYFRVNVVACLLALVVLMVTHSYLANLVCIGAVGFFASSIFSIIYSLALQNTPDKANQISGLMITAIAGGGVVTPIIGISIAQAGVLGGVCVIIACTLYLAWCAFKS